MKTVVVAKAGPARHRKAVENCTIEILNPVPDFDWDDPEWEIKSSEFFSSQAKEIVDALQTHLPGGTLDAIILEMMERKIQSIKESPDFSI